MSDSSPKNSSKPSTGTSFQFGLHIPHLKLYKSV